MRKNYFGLVPFYRYFIRPIQLVKKMIMLQLIKILFIGEDKIIMGYSLLIPNLLVKTMKTWQFVTDA